MHVVDELFVDPSVVRVYYCVGSAISYYVTTIEELMMAATAGEKNLELTSTERVLVVRALEYLTTSIERAIKQESNVEIANLRRKEVAQIKDLSAKFL